MIRRSLFKLHPAFTLIEVIISVFIISVVVLSAFEISSRSMDRAHYLSKRYRHAYEDSLYLQKEIVRYHKENRSAYELLDQTFKLEDRSREILKNSSRDIFIDTPSNLFTYDQSSQMQLDAIVLKKGYVSRYFHFKEIKGI